MAAPSDKIRPMTPAEQRSKGIKYSPTAPAGAPSAMTGPGFSQTASMGMAPRNNKPTEDQKLNVLAAAERAAPMRAGLQFGERGGPIGNPSPGQKRMEPLTEDDIINSGPVDFNDRRRHSREAPTYGSGPAKGLTRNQALNRLEMEPDAAPSPQQNFERRKESGMPINDTEYSAGKSFAERLGMDFDRNLGYVSKGSGQPASMQPSVQPAGPMANPDSLRKSPAAMIPNDADYAVRDKASSISSKRRGRKKPESAIANTLLPSVMDEKARRDLAYKEAKGRNQSWSDAVAFEGQNSEEGKKKLMSTFEKPKMTKPITLTSR